MVDVNATVGPILYQIAALFSPLTDLVLASITLIIVVAVVGLITGIFGDIVDGMKSAFNFRK